MTHSTSNRITRRTLLGSSLGIASAAALSACGAGGTSSGSAPKTVSLQLFGTNSELNDWLNKTAFPALKAQHGLSVELRETDWGSSFQKMLTGAASGTLADVTMMGQVQTAALAAKGAFLSLDDYVKSWSDSANFYPAMYKNGQYNGHQYAIPFIADIRTAYYRSDLLQKAGVSNTDLPQDWNSYLALAQELKGKANLAAPAYWGADNSVGLMQTFSQLLYQAGGSYFDAAGKSSLSAEPGVTALNYMMSFFQQNLSNPGIVYNGSGATPLTTAQAAMTFTGYSAVQNVLQFNKPVAADVIAGLPLAEKSGGQPTTVAWINKFGISAKTKNPDLAWQLLSFLVSKDNITKLDQYLGGLSVRTDLKSADFLPGVTADLAASAQYAGALPQNPNMIDIQQKVNIAMQQAIRGQGTAKSILSDLDNAINTINKAS
ncbi:MAG: ABC transporter substrate-binding protein [Propionibacteriaceae bacterium]